jgi:hypothetical protein
MLVVDVFVVDVPFATVALPDAGVMPGSYPDAERAGRSWLQAASATGIDSTRMLDKIGFRMLTSMVGEGTERGNESKFRAASTPSPRASKAWFYSGVTRAVSFCPT